MSAVAASQVTFLDKYDRGSAQGQVTEACRRVSIALSSQGSATNPIPASVLMLAEIYKVVPIKFIVSGNPKGVIAFLDATGANVLLASLIQATDASRYDPADLTGTLELEVCGRGL